LIHKITIFYNHPEFWSSKIPTIQQVIERITAEFPEPLPADTVDTIKAGDPSRPVTGIVTTFMATWEVLRQAVAAGANFVITHEPTYYSHRDNIAWLAGDAVYPAKRRLIDENGLTIWRYHDGWPMHNPDGILLGAMRQLGWISYQDPQQPYLFHHPPVSLKALSEDLKSKSNATMLRVAGNLDAECSEIAYFPGSGPGEDQVEVLGKHPVDVIVCGESPEWQTPEYARDAAYAGLSKNLILLGHERSEEAGMGYLAAWLREQYPGIPVKHISSGDPFHYI
jgi:putative NIF3 family GTP cyclohydrolase 1 type 2